MLHNRGAGARNGYCGGPGKGLTPGRGADRAPDDVKSDARARPLRPQARAHVHLRARPAGRRRRAPPPRAARRRRPATGSPGWPGGRPGGGSAPRRARQRRPAAASPLRVAGPGSENRSELSGPRATMTDVARLGVGIELVGRRAELAALTGRAGARRRRPRRPGCCWPATPGWASPGCWPSWSSGRPAAGSPGAGRPLPGHGRVGAALPAVHRDRRAAGRHPARAGRAARRAAPPAARPAAARRAGRRGPPARPGPGVRRRALGARRAGRDARRCWWSWRTCTGPTGPAGTCWCSCCPGSPASGWCWWPATAPTTCTGGTRCARCSPSWCGCPRCERVELGAAGPGEHAAAGPPAGRRDAVRAGRCTAPPGAARATPSSPRSWSRPGPTACRTSWPSCWSPGSTGWPRTPSGCCGSPRWPAAGSGTTSWPRCPGWRPTSWRQALRDAVADHVLVAVPGSATDGDAYAFRHALLREAVYHELLPGERSRIHAGYAALLAEPATGAPGPAEPGRAAELAHHAMAGHDLPLALAASVRAAGEADEREAPAELLLHAERALELWRAVPDAEAVAGIDEATVTRWAAWGASATGDPDRGLALGRRALELAEQRADPRAVGPAVAALRAAPARPGRPRAGGPRGGAPLPGAGRRSAAVRAAGVGARGAGPGARPARPVRRGDHRGRGRPRGGRGGTRRRRGRPRRRAPTPWSRWPCATSTAAGRSRRGGSSTRPPRWPGAPGNLGVELRAYYAVGISLLDAGRLRAAGDQLAAGARRAEATGTTWSGYGLDLRVALVVARFLHGDWDAAVGRRGAGRRVGVGHRGRPAGRGGAARRGRTGPVRRGRPAAGRAARDRHRRRPGDHVRRPVRGRGRALAGPARRGARARAGGAGRAEPGRRPAGRPAPGLDHAGRARGDRAGRSGGRRRAAGRRRRPRGRPGRCSASRSGRPSTACRGAAPSARRAGPGCAAPAPS